MNVVGKRIGPWTCDSVELDGPTQRFTVRMTGDKSKGASYKQCRFCVERNPVTEFSRSEDRLRIYEFAAYRCSVPSLAGLAFAVAFFYDEDELLDDQPNPCAGPVDCASCGGCDVSTTYAKQETAGEYTVGENGHSLVKKPPKGYTVKAGPWAEDAESGNCDVCKYATPRLVLIDGEPVMCVPPVDVCPTERSLRSDEKRFGVGQSLACQQAKDFEDAKTEELRQQGRARIQRLLEWPWCGHREKPVDLAWVDDKAHWVCKECKAWTKPAPHVELEIPKPKPRKPKPRKPKPRKPKIEWVNGHLTLR